MSKLKYYALCCRNIAATKRHASYIPHNDLVIVLNSMDQEYIAVAEAWCKEQQIEYYITESDGTPATGKNSVMDLFLNSNNQYMVLVDGDDFITPHGLVVYDMISQLDNPPDAVALENQFGLVPNEHHTDKGCSSRYASNMNDPDQIHGKGVRAYTFDDEWWNDAKEGKLFRKDVSHIHQRFIKHTHKYLSQRETHLRITFYSKRAAIYYFDNEHIIGEDTLQYYNIKDAWAKGELNLKHMNEKYPSYVYDQRLGGIVSSVSKTPERFIEWVAHLNSKLDQMIADEKMHTNKPSLLQLNFDDSYTPDVLGMVA